MYLLSRSGREKAKSEERRSNSRCPFLLQITISSINIATFGRRTICEWVCLCHLYSLPHQCSSIYMAVATRLQPCSSTIAAEHVNASSSSVRYLASDLSNIIYTAQDMFLNRIQEKVAQAPARPRPQAPMHMCSLYKKSRKKIRWASH